MDIICQRCDTKNQYYTKQSGPHQTAYCNNCHNYIKHIPKEGPVILYFGQYKGRSLSSLTSAEEIRYLQWLVTGDIKEKLREAITIHIAAQ